MNKYKLLGMAFAAIIIVAGFVYLYADAVSVPAAFGLCALAIFGMGTASLLEIRQRGERGFVSYLPALCFFILGACVAAVCVYVIVK